MGLNVVAQIVKLHHGSIHVESAPNEGTQVHIDVPGPEVLHAWLQEQTDSSTEVNTADLNSVSVSAFRRG
jgi:chemotaxis protein histidine kinase CheA